MEAYEDMKPGALMQFLEYEKGLDFLTPQTVEGKWEFLRERALSCKEVIEEELNNKYSTFEAIQFIKKNINYVIRVKVDGDECIDLYMKTKLLLDVEGGKNQKDPIAFMKT